MTPEELQDALIQVAGMPMIERSFAINELYDRLGGRGRSPMTKTELKSALQMVISAGNEERLQEQISQEIAALNQEYFIMAAQSKVRIGSIEHRELNGHQVQHLNMMTQADFNLLKANQIIGDQTAAEIFVTHPERREYRGFFIHPDKPAEHNGKLNLWSGFSVEPKRGSVKLFKTHVLKLCGGDEDVADYVMKWLAWGFQNPSKPIGTVILLIGEQGTGKGTLGNLIRSIWGGHGLRIGTTEDLVGKHNQHLISACYAFVDEPPFAGNKGIADVLKGLITEPTLSVEPKFQDRYEVDNMLKMLCATNHAWAAQIEPSDRRFCVIPVPDHMRQSPKEYWQEFQEKVMSKEGKAAVLHYLLNLDCSDWDAERDRPYTTAYLDQKLASMSQDALWWRIVSERQTWQVGRSAVEVPDCRMMADGSMEYSKHGVYGMYCQWHDQTQRGSPVDSTLFWRNARKLLDLGDTAFPRVGGRGKQERKVVIPDFEEVYARIIKSLGGKIDE